MPYSCNSACRQASQATRPRSSNLRRFRDDFKTARDVACRKLRRELTPDRSSIPSRAGMTIRSVAIRSGSALFQESAGRSSSPSIAGSGALSATSNLQALEEARPALAARGPSLVAISPQTPANSRKAQRQLNLGFPMLSDAGGSVAAACGVRWTFPDYLRETSRKLGVDLTRFNGEDKLDPAHAGPLRDRPGPDNRLRRGQS